MYCKGCGQQLDDDAKFCKFCGSNQPDLINDQPGGTTINNSIKDEVELSHEEQKTIIRKHNIFHSEDEILIDTLGSGFLSSWYVESEFRKSILFCSNKRVYFRGRLFYRGDKNKINYDYCETSVNLEDITGVKYIIENPIHRFKLLGFLLIIITILLLLSQARELSEIKDGLYLFSGVLFLFSFIVTIIYYAKKNKWLIIEYAGGEIGTSCHWYHKKSIKRFMRNISLQKDLLK